jgi:hypothetical protein
MYINRYAARICGGAKKPDRTPEETSFPDYVADSRERLPQVFESGEPFTPKAPIQDRNSGSILT